MKTMKTVKRETAERRKLFAKRYGDRNARGQEAKAYLDSARSWPRPDEANENTASRIRADVEAGRCFPVGIACDVCGFELAGVPGFPCMSYPNCRWVTCGVCGYNTTQRSNDIVE